MNDSELNPLSSPDKIMNILNGVPHIPVVVLDAAKDALPLTEALA